MRLEEPSAAHRARGGPGGPGPDHRGAAAPPGAGPRALPRPARPGRGPGRGAGRGAPTSSPGAAPGPGLVHRGGVEIVHRVSRSDEDAPAGPPRLRGGTPPRSLSAVRRALLPTGEVADDASPKLADDPAHPRAPAGLQLTSVMEGYLRTRETERLLQDRVITTRNDRYVLLLKADTRASSRGSSTAARAPGRASSSSPSRRRAQQRHRVAAGRGAARGRRGSSRTSPPGRETARTTSWRWRRSSASSTRCRPWRSSRVDMDAHAPGDRRTTWRLELVDSRHPLLMPRLAERARGRADRRSRCR